MENINTIEPSISFLNSKTYIKENEDNLIAFYYKVMNNINKIEKCPIAQENILKAYCIIEENFFNEIKHYNQRKIYKRTLNDILYEQFFKHNTQGRLKHSKEINLVFTKYLASISLQRELQKDYNFDITYSFYDKSDNQAQILKKTLQEMENCIYNECISFIMHHCSIDHIPLFLINKSLIKQKVAFIWKINYEIPVNHLKMKSQYGYEYLSNIFTSFSKMEVKPFDLAVFDKKTLGILFKCFFLSNLVFMHQNQKNYAIFKGRLMTYLRIMNLNQDKEIELLTNYVKGIYSQYDNDKDKESTHKRVYIEIKQSFEELKQLISNDFRILAIAKGSENMLFIILSFSLMLNNIIKVEWNKDAIKVNSRFNCSACERRFLMNFLDNIDTFIPQSHNSINDNKQDIDLTNSSSYVNYYVENSIISNLFKASSADLFDSSMQYKIIIPYDRIIYHIEHENNEKKFRKLFDFFLGEFITSVTVEEMNISFIPHDLVNISPHICICLGKHFDQKMMDQLNNEKKSIDYYCFSWNEKQKMNVFKSIYNFIFKNEEESIENNTLYTGRLLAYILASRTLFKYQTFSFVAYSQGANVVKYCIRELHRIHKKIQSDCHDMINDVIFINGQTVINDNDIIALNSIVSGRIINAYSKKDKSDMKNKHNNIDEDIEMKMICYNEIQHSAIENYDISYLKLSEEEYQMNLNSILSKVKFY